MQGYKLFITGHAHTAKLCYHQSEMKSPNTKIPTTHPEWEPKPCAHPGCDRAGEHRAPRSRDALHTYHWFCLEHVREYNAAWNYYEGMDDAAVEAELRNDVVWRRKTWPLGARIGGETERFVDPIGIMDEKIQNRQETYSGDMQLQSLTPEERQAISVLGLVAPVTRADVKQRYKVLAKTLHPDSNGGDRRAEDRLKLVNYAYTTLRDSERLK